MAWRLRYGDAWIGLDTPAEFPARTLAASPMTPLLDPVQAVRDALDSPTGSPRLRDLAAGARHVLIVVPNHPGTGLPVVLPQILDVLQDSGVGLRQVEILVANGPGVRLEADEMEAIVGSDVWNRVVVRQHDPDASAQMVDLGETERGTALMLSKKTIESGQLLILAGTIFPDPYSGFEGGPNLILPGLASRVSGLAHERLALNNLPDTGLYHACEPGELEGNLLFEDALEGAEKAEADFLVHTVVDESGRLVKVVAGEWRKSYEMGCDWLRARLRVNLQEERAWAILSAGSPVTDTTLYAAHRVLLQGATCVRDDGHVVFLAACGGGFGSPSFEKWLKTEDFDALEKGVRAKFDLGARAAVALRHLARRVKVHLVSGLPAAAVQASGMIPHADAESAWAAVAAVYPLGSAGYVVPQPGYILPFRLVKPEPLAEERAY